MNTRRAPEMACGDLLVLFNDLIGRRLTDLMLEGPIASLARNNTTFILADFARGRRHLRWVFQVKFGHWRQLPWVLHALGHHMPKAAQDGAARAVSLWDSAPGEVQNHPIIRQLLAPDGVLHNDMMQFSTGKKTLAELPRLKVVAGKLKFSTICERWVEGLHAKSKRLLEGARHCSPVHLAWAFIHRPLRTMLRQKPELFDTLAASCSAVRNPRLALHRMGFGSTQTSLASSGN